MELFIVKLPALSSFQSGSPLAPSAVDWITLPIFALLIEPSWIIALLMNIWPPTIETGATVCPLELLNQKHKTSNWSAIWVLPLVALAIGAWLAWRAFDQAGVDIQVRFESGDGIQANKTEVLYKGISVGKVTDLHVSKDIKGVVATIEIKKEAQEYLSKDTRFWLVKPRVSLAGVTGLETLVSGVYIERPATCRRLTPMHWMKNCQPIPRSWRRTSSATCWVNWRSRHG